MKRPLLLLIAYFIFLCTHAQKPVLKFRHLTGENGLSQTHVIHLTQDYKGFIWICTQNGLNKYDGYKITVYKNDPNDSTSLLSNSVLYAYEDTNKNLWIATSHGLNRYDRENDRFIRVKFPVVEKPILYIHVIYEDKNGGLWIGTDGAAYLYDISKKTITTYLADIKDKDPTVKSFCEDKQGNLWIAKSDKLYRFDKERKSYKIFAHEPGNTSGLSENISIICILGRQNGDVMVGTRGGGLNIFDSKTKTFKQYKNDPHNSNSLSSNVVISLFEDSRGNLWVGTENGGLNLFHSDTGTFSNYSKNIYNPQSVLSNSISTIHEDVSGNLWVGTHNGGVSFCSPYRLRFEQHKQEMDKNSLSHNNVKALMEDKEGNVWIGTDGGGLNVWNREADVFSYYRLKANNNKTISSDIVLSAFEDSDEYLWFGTYEHGLNKFNPKTKTFTYYKVDPNNETSISDNTVWSMAEDDNKNLWIGTLQNGMCMLNKETNKFIQYRSIVDDTSTISSNWIICVFIDSKKNLWIGTYWGLNLFNKESNTFTRYMNDKTVDGSISHNQINSIFEDKRGNLWVGTPGGLNLLNPKTNQFTVYTQKDGLPNDLIQSIQEDDHGNLWISTLKEISKFNVATGNFKNYAIDGVDKNEFFQNVSLKTKDGKIAFGGTYGFNIFHPDSIKDNNFIPPVILTDFQVFNKTVAINDKSSLTTNINEAKQITLSYEESVFSFEFAALNYVSVEKNQYAYKMQGFDKEWNYSGTRRMATYTNLDPGEYIFKVKASNNDGVWNEEGISINIRIIPPFWKTWWFRLILFSLAFGSIYTWYKLRIIKIKMQQVKLEKQVAERTEEVTMQKEKLEVQSLQLQTANSGLTEANEELVLQRGKIEDLYTEVKDSIRAAKVIQQSILPPKKLIKQYLPNFFILNRPKDVVSGDFYWFDVINEKIVIAAVDCTGHGVSGAFMSIKAHNLLTQCVHAEDNLKPSQILDMLNQNLIKELHQHDEDSGISNGMDIGLCVIDKDKRCLQFAAAINSLYIIRGNEVIQVKGDQFSVGLSIKGKINVFKSNEVMLQPGDMIYLFSDGYADQIGGPNGNEKFKYGRFRELLLSISNECVEKQHEMLDQNIDSWRGIHEQLDDILVIGFKID